MKREATITITTSDIDVHFDPPCQTAEEPTLVEHLACIAVKAIVDELKIQGTKILIGEREKASGGALND